MSLDLCEIKLPFRQLSEIELFEYEPKLTLDTGLWEYKCSSLDMPHQYHSSGHISFTPTADGFEFVMDSKLGTLESTGELKMNLPDILYDYETAVLQFSAWERLIDLTHGQIFGIESTDRRATVTSKVRCLISLKAVPSVWKNYLHMTSDSDSFSIYPGYGNERVSFDLTLFTSAQLSVTSTYGLDSASKRGRFEDISDLEDLVITESNPQKSRESVGYLQKRCGRVAAIDLISSQIQRIKLTIKTKDFLYNTPCNLYLQFKRLGDCN